MRGRGVESVFTHYFYRKNISERIFIFIYNKIYDQIQD